MEGSENTLRTFLDKHPIPATVLDSHGCFSKKFGLFVVPKGWRVIMCAPVGGVCFDNCIQNIAESILQRSYTIGDPVGSDSYDKAMSKILDLKNWTGSNNTLLYWNQEQGGARTRGSFLGESNVNQFTKVYEAGQQCPNQAFIIETDRCRDPPSGLFSSLLPNSVYTDCELANRSRDDELLKFLGERRSTLFWDKNIASERFKGILMFDLVQTLQKYNNMVEITAPELAFKKVIVVQACMSPCDEDFVDGYSRLKDPRISEKPKLNMPRGWFSDWLYGRQEEETSTKKRPRTATAP